MKFSAKQSEQFVRLVRVALCALSLLLTLASSALAAEPSTIAAPAEGEPTIDQTRPVGYYIWHNDMSGSMLFSAPTGTSNSCSQFVFM